MFVQVAGVRLFFDVEGAKFVPDGPVMRERPTLICLHGGPGLDHSSLRPYLTPLSAVAQVIYLDQRGHGRSDRSSAGNWTLDRWADDVRDFCDVLGIERPAVLGTSFGGYVAMVYAIRHAEHPVKLILISTALRGTGHPVRRRNVEEGFERVGGAAAREAVQRVFDQRTPEAYAQYKRICGPLYNRRLPEPDSVERAIRSNDILPFFECSGGEGVRFNLAAEMGRVRCPTLVIGGEDDPITPIAEQQQIVDALPPGLARLERFARCGHGVFPDETEGMLRVTLDFLAS